MKKKIIAVVISELIGMSLGHAGAMGAVSTQVVPSTIPYISGEASYTWNQVGNLSLNGLSPALSKQPWGGRLAGGFVHRYSEKLSFSEELGGGYYGSMNTNIPSLGTNINSHSGWCDGSKL